MRTTYLLIFLLLSIFTFGQDWKWKNPLPTGNILNEVKFVDSTTIIAVGYQGTILKSTDKGLNWDVKISGTNVNLNSIAVIDSDTIYVSGGDHSVLKSINGGESWEKIFDGTGANNGTNQLFFVNHAIGYLLGNSMQLLKTTDCGKTWIDLNVGFEFQNVPCIYFMSEDVGFGVSSTSDMLLKTVDGGFTWIESELPIRTFDYYSIIFIDENNGFLSGSYGTLLMTSDGGETWNFNEPLSEMAYYVNIQSIEFINNKVGYLAGEKKIYKTNDSGNNWEEIYESEFDLFSICFIDSMVGVAVGGDNKYEVSGIIYTSDKGNAWNKVSYTIGDNTRTTSYINEIKFLNDFVGYAVGGNPDTYGGFVLKTEDAGENWSILNTGSQTRHITDIALPASNIIYTVGEMGQVLKSTNGGSSWAEQSSGTSESLYVVQFVDNDNGYAVGYNGTIIKTSNGGDTWQKLESNTTKPIQALFFRNKLEGYITYHDWSIDSTVLLTTANGGLNWSSKNIGTLRHPREIVFVNNDTAFIVGSFGSILRTMDGGNTWEASYQNGNDYMGVFFTTENTGYVVALDGEISMTENCGDNWTVLNSGTDKQIRSVFFTDINTGYVSGSDGIILKTTNSGSQLKELNQPYYTACKGDVVELMLNTIGGKKPLTYIWSNNETNKKINVLAEKDTTYYVTITDDNQESITVEISLNVTYAETPEISLSGDTLISTVKYGNQWYRNDSLISGATSNKYILIEAGKYYSIVYRNSCYSDKSNIIDYPVNIEKLLEKNIEVFPNPTNDFLTIILPKEFTYYDITVIDIQGQVLMKGVTNSYIEQLNIRTFNDGIYLLRIELDNNIVIRKFIRTH